MRTEEEGSGREAARCASEAFRCQGANLLPDTNSSAMASSLSIWGRWISLTLHWNIAHTPGCLPAAPFLFLVF